MKSLCSDCNYVGFDADINGYCNCPDYDMQYRKIVIDDLGCKITECKFFKQYRATTIKELSRGY